MGARARLFLIAIGSLLVLATFAAGAGFLWLRERGRPLRTGEARIAGLEGPVEVRWDSWGVPHVRARRTLDLAAAVGWLHANDRLFQMEVSRRAASGRLAEIFGKTALPMDRRLRTLGLRRAAKENWRVLGAESRAWLAAYADGVNAWVASRSADMPLEWHLLGIESEPWEPIDSLSVAMLMAYDLSMLEMRFDETRWAWWKRLGPDAARDLSGRDGLELAAELEDLQQFPGEGGEAPEASRQATIGWSNNWALGAAHTTTGTPLVANDPHLALRLPASWYQLHLRSPELEVGGMTLPGLPAVVIGQNADLAWALTNAALDDHDFLIERIDAELAQVQRGQDWVPVQSETQQISVRGSRDEPLELDWTDVGPLLPPDPGLGLPARSLNWAAYRPADLLAPFLGLARARTVEDVLSAIEGYTCPAQNLLVATREGELLQTLLGRVPERSLGHGGLPVPGWSPAHVWRGFRAADTNPRLREGRNGLLASANDDPRPEGYALDLPGEFDVPHRADRIRELLATSTRWSPEGLGAAQSDARSLFATEVVLLIADDYEGDARVAFQTLFAWGGSMDLYGPSALFAILERELHDRIFGDELSAADLDPLQGPARRSALLRALAGEMRVDWFDHVETSEREQRTRILSLALERAWGECVTRWGDDPADWSYAELRTLALRHPLGVLPLVGRWFDRGPFAVPGSRTTICAWFGDWKGDTMPIIAGPSMRWVADVADPDRSLAVIPGGQSGHAADTHYDDQLRLFVTGEMRPALWSEESIAANQVSATRLVP